MPRKRAVQPTRRAGGTAVPSVAVTTCCAAADSHMPCTMGDSSPASSAAARIGVDRVVVTGHDRERPHVDRRGDRDVAAAAARGVGGVVRDRTAGADRVGQFGGAGAAADREPLLEGGQHRAVGVGDGDRNRDHPADLGVDGSRSRCGDGQFGCRRSGSGLTQVRGVVEVDQAQQTLDNREAGVGHGRTDRGEHRRPAAADERVGHHRQCRRQRRAEGGGDAGVVGDLLGIPRAPSRSRRRRAPAAVRRARRRRRRWPAPTAWRSRRPRWTPPARRRRRCVAGQGEPDLDPGARQRDAQHDLVAWPRRSPAAHRWTGVWRCGFRAPASRRGRRCGAPGWSRCARPTTRRERRARRPAAR